MLATVKIVVSEPGLIIIQLGTYPMNSINLVENENRTKAARLRYRLKPQYAIILIKKFIHSQKLDML